jgi:hypothetical protein
MRKYKTGYIAFRHEVNPKTEIIGKYFRVVFQLKSNDKYIQNGYYTIIITKDFQNARKVNQLIASSLSLLDASASFTLDSIPQIIPQQDSEEQIPKFHLGVFELARARIPEAISIAAKVSFSRKYYLSLLKYQLACEIHSNDIMDLYPEYFKLSRNPADHLRIATAIIIFYSILEELGLEIRANQNNPSKINGIWNPKVRADLEQRLLKCNINIDKKIDWALRSTPTKIERLRKPPLINKSKWAAFNIRDSEISIIDAISQISWLRSKIASHKLNENYISLSIYDLSNVNFLVRRILLESLEMF